jgi:crotonobetainyl-CoA:carnitine CoA-transferase CaiB-like acyl-CoA transferase
MTSAPEGMLFGLKVIDLTSVVFGPYATQILCDLGAEVIKIEPQIGDKFRYAGKPAKTFGMGPVHMGLNRGKQSVVLDLKNPSDAQTLRDLIPTADVFIHNIRAKAIEKLGFGYEAVKAIRPNIVYVHCMGFGSDGPYADRQAYDDVIQAATGTVSLASRVDKDPRPRYLPSVIADKVAGLHGAYASLAAIIHQLRTGQGQHVEVPMFECFTDFILKEHLFEAAFIPPTGSIGYPRQLDPNRQPFPTKDGYISIVPYTDEAVCDLFGLLDGAHILQGTLFNTPQLRARNMSLIYAEIARLTPAKTSAEWEEIFVASQIPAMPVRNLDDILSDPHLVATDFFRHQTHPTEGDYIQMRAPVRFSAAPERNHRPAPLIGQDTDAIKASLKSEQAQ